MEDYPHTLAELEKRFSTEEACTEYLAALRWPDELRLPHLVASLLKRWLLGTYQGAVWPSTNIAKRGKLFYRLVQQALHVDPLPEAELKASAFPHTDKNLDVLES